MTLDQQLIKGTRVLQGMFADFETQNPPIPDNASIEELWHTIQALREELREIKKIKRGTRPKVEQAVKLLIEDQDLAQLSLPILAGLVRAVFKLNGLKTNCSAKSIRWYLSQRALTWDIIRRQDAELDIELIVEE